jgi:hypothetical protein
MHVGVHVKSPLLLPDFNQNWKMLTNVVISVVSDFIKICSVVVEVHMDIQMDRQIDGEANRCLFVAFSYKCD